VSKKQHGKQLDRARSKRNDSKFDRRTTRNRVIILVMAVLMVLSLVGAALTSAIGGAGDPPPPPDDDPVADAGPGPCGEAPSNNLVNLAEDGYYEGVVFHRVIPGFVIQAGDPAGTGCGQEDCANFDPDEPSETAETLHEQVREDNIEQLRAAVEAEGEDFDEEVDEELLAQLPGGYPRGTVAMANAGPDTNGSQFYVAQGDPTALPGPQFTVLGTVIEGMDVVDAIAASPTDATDRPIEAVTIRGVSIDQR